MVYDPPEVARARATSRLTSDTVSSLAGADRAALVLAVAKDDDLRSFERRERTAKRASEAKNRDRTRYMGSQDASASCLVSAHDRIMGTHRMSAGHARRLKELEVENARLKKLLAEAGLDKAMLKELAEGKW